MFEYVKLFESEAALVEREEHTCSETVPEIRDFKNEFKKLVQFVYIVLGTFLPFNKTENKRWAGTLYFQPSLDVKANSVIGYHLVKSWHFEPLENQMLVILRGMNPPQALNVHTHRHTKAVPLFKLYAER